MKAFLTRQQVGEEKKLHAAIWTIVQHESPPIYLLQREASKPSWEVYQQYIDHELEEGDPARIQCVFERAVQDNCLHAQLWSLYTRFLVSIDRTTGFLLIFFTVQPSKDCVHLTEECLLC